MVPPSFWWTLAAFWTRSSLVWCLISFVRCSFFGCLIAVEDTTATIARRRMAERIVMLREEIGEGPMLDSSQRESFITTQEKHKSLIKGILVYCETTAQLYRGILSLVTCYLRDWEEEGRGLRSDGRDVSLHHKELLIHNDVYAKEDLTFGDCMCQGCWLGNIQEYHVRFTVQEKLQQFHRP